LGRFVLRGKLLPGWLIWWLSTFSWHPKPKSIRRIFLGTESKKKETQTIYRFGLPCSMFGFCDERPEANPHNPISCGVFSPDPCCELCCDRMGQIAKTTVNLREQLRFGWRTA
jgi:hypothetical protein